MVKYGPKQIRSLYRNLSKVPDEIYNEVYHDVSSKAKKLLTEVKDKSRQNLDASRGKGYTGISWENQISDSDKIFAEGNVEIKNLSNKGKKIVEYELQLNSEHAAVVEYGGVITHRKFIQSKGTPMPIGMSQGIATNPVYKETGKGNPYVTKHVVRMQQGYKYVGNAIEELDVVNRYKNVVRDSVNKHKKIVGKVK